jgi:hypothetical protein
VVCGVGGGLRCRRRDPPQPYLLKDLPCRSFFRGFRGHGGGFEEVLESARLEVCGRRGPPQRFLGKGGAENVGGDIPDCVLGVGGPASWVGVGVGVGVGHRTSRHAAKPDLQIRGFSKIGRIREGGSERNQLIEVCCPCLRAASISEHPLPSPGRDRTEPGFGTAAKHFDSA